MSAQGIELLTLSVTAAGALTKYRAVTVAGAHAATSLYGIAKFDASAAGQEITVAVEGTTIVEAGAAIPAGTATVVADTSGRVIPGGTSSACLGRLVRGQAASAAGDLVEVYLCLTV